MTTHVMSAQEFSQNLDDEVDKAIEQHTVLHVNRDGGRDFVVLGAEDWRSIEETIHLNQSPGLVESLHQAAVEPLEAGTRLEDLEW